MATYAERYECVRRCSRQSASRHSVAQGGKTSRKPNGFEAHRVGCPRPGMKLHVSQGVRPPHLIADLTCIGHIDIRILQAMADGIPLVFFSL